MIAKDLINYMIPPLKPEDHIDKARQWMEELRINELPVANKGAYLGLITEEIIYDNDENFQIISDFPLIASDVKVHEQKHFYDVLRLAYAHGVRLVPVIDDDENFQGVISIEDVIEAFASTASVSTPGAIMVLSLQFRDYSLSDISRLVEANDAKILSSHVSNDPKDLGKVNVTLKLNVEEISHIQATLESNGYPVSDSFSNPLVQSEDSERFDNLMNYLNL
jgi:predicted transcriptional regulator